MIGCWKASRLASRMHANSPWNIACSCSGRLQDRADILGIARRRGPVLDWSAIRDRLEPLAAVKDEPDIMESVARLEREFGR